MVIESDCLADVQAIRSKVEIRSSFCQVVLDCGQELGIQTIFLCFLLNNLQMWWIIILQERRINILIVLSIGIMFLLNSEIIFC